MCSRFEINVNARELFDRLGLKGDPKPFEATVPRAEVRPTDLLVCIRNAEAAAVPWGWIVPFSPRPLINARAETLAQKPTFRDRLDDRCLIPATAYFEWRDPGDGTKKRRNRIAPVRAELMLFAGLLDGEGRATIVTCAPAPRIAHVHTRMPVVLGPEGADAWASDAPFEAVAAHLAPDPAADLAAVENAPARPPPPRQGDLFS